MYNYRITDFNYIFKSQPGMHEAKLLTILDWPSQYYRGEGVLGSSMWALLVL